jgi:hypothetical protein
MSSIRVIPLISPCPSNLFPNQNQNHRSLSLSLALFDLSVFFFPQNSLLPKSLFSLSSLGSFSLGGDLAQIRIHGLGDSLHRNGAMLFEITGVKYGHTLLLLRESRDDSPHALQVEQPLSVVGEREHQEVVDDHVLQDRRDPLLELVLPLGVRSLEEYR